MNETKHTPGPWVVKSSKGLYPQIETPIGKVGIAGVDLSISRGIGHWVTDRETSLANAQLIASAPDLLEALASLAEAFGFSGGCDCGTGTCCQCKALSAIAKAKGESK